MASAPPLSHTALSAFTLALACAPAATPICADAPQSTEVEVFWASLKLQVLNVKRLKGYSGSFCQVPRLTGDLLPLKYQWSSRGMCSSQNKNFRKKRQYCQKRSQGSQKVNFNIFTYCLKKLNQKY